MNPLSTDPSRILVSNPHKRTGATWLNPGPHGISPHTSPRQLPVVTRHGSLSVHAGERPPDGQIVMHDISKSSLVPCGVPDVETGLVPRAWSPSADGLAIASHQALCAASWDRNRHRQPPHSPLGECDPF